MKIATRMFLNPKDMTDTSFVMLDGRKKSDDRYSYILKISFGYFVVHIHNYGKSIQEARELFVPKLLKLVAAIDASLEADMQIPRCERMWLNGEVGDVKHYSGAVSWSVDKNNWNFAISDCHRTIRADPYLSDVPTAEELADLDVQRERVRTLGKFIKDILPLVRGS